MKEFQAVRSQDVTVATPWHRYRLHEPRTRFGIHVTFWPKAVNTVDSGGGSMKMVVN